jgi:hypothetical protein
MAMKSLVSVPKANTLPEGSMDDIMLILFPFVPFFAILLLLSHCRVSCPDCGDPLPFFQSPLTKTRRQWIAGGSVCQRSGCETNMVGQKVTADTFPATSPTL